jgi:protein-disulfide isomerase
LIPFVTRNVKQAACYNRAVRSQILGQFLIALVCTPLLAGAACHKTTSTTADPGMGSALDQPTEIAQAGPVDTTPLPGVDISKMDADQQKSFYALVGSLSSPCGKAHSLRTSFTTDASCKRAPFAVRYLMMLIDDGAPEDIARKDWESKYKAKAAPLKIDVSKSPHEGGADDAPIRFVEYFDYGCPHCAAFKPMMEQVLQDEAGKVVTYFKMFPIESKHPDSRSAGQAALAANTLGKFKEMHDILFAKTPEHNHDAVAGYAKQLGLDPTKFEAAYQAANQQVTDDLKQGEDMGVDATPTIFFNDRKYDGPLGVKYLEAWIEEELAVNR